MSNELQDWEKDFIALQGEQKPELTEEPKQELPEPEKAPEEAGPEKVEPKAEPKVEPKAEEAEPFAGFKQLPKEAQDEFLRVREEREAARQAEAKALANWRAQQGQLAPAQRRVSELERQIEELRKSAPAAKPEKFDKWKQEYPEESEAVAEGIDHRLNPLAEKLANAERVIEQLRLEREAEKQDRERGRVYAAHSDAHDLLYVKDSAGQQVWDTHSDGVTRPRINHEFMGWLERQNQHKHEMWRSNSADDIIDLLTDYKRDRLLRERAAPPQVAPTTPSAKKILRDLAPTLRPMQSTSNADTSNLKEWEREFLALQAGSQP